FKTLCFFNYALMIRQDYDITSSLQRGALHSFSATSKWTKEIKEYLRRNETKKYRSESHNEDVCSNHEADIELDENDVYVDKSGTASFMNETKVCGMDIDLFSKI
nr:hypothetical protein [Tanacetum cinerariifolium]